MDPPLLPPPLVVADARRRVREARRAEGRRTAVLDDYPTGSQSIHGVEVVTALDRQHCASALADAGATCFVLTNTRSDSTVRGHVLAEVDAASDAQREATAGP